MLIYSSVFFYAQGLVEFRGCRVEGFGTTGLLVFHVKFGDKVQWT